MSITPQTLLRFTVGAAITAVVLFLMWYFSSIVIYILVSAVLAIMGRPLVARISRGRIGRWRVPRWCGALVTLLVIWIVFAVMCGLFVPLVTNKLYQLAHLDFSTVLTSVEEPLQRIQDYLTHFFSLPETQVSFKDTLISFLQSLINFDTINTAFSSVVSLAVSSVIAFFSISFITFFFLRDDGLFYAMVTALFPDRYQQNVTHALNSVTVLLSRYFRGILAESFLLMLAVSLVMMAFGMRAQDAFFIGLIMGVMNVVPYAGPTIGGAVSVCMGIITPIEGMSIGHTMLVIAGSLLILKGLDDFVLQPTLYSERVKAQPLEIFLVILIAGSLAGVIGMLLAIPLYTVLRVFAKEFFSQISLVRKLTEKTDVYGLTEDKIRLITTASALHDIGKITDGNWAVSWDFRPLIWRLRMRIRSKAECMSPMWRSTVWSIRPCRIWGAIPRWAEVPDISKPIFSTFRAISTVGGSGSSCGVRSATSASSIRWRSCSARSNGIAAVF